MTWENIFDKFRFIYIMVISFTKMFYETIIMKPFENFTWLNKILSHIFVYFELYLALGIIMLLWRHVKYTRKYWWMLILIYVGIVLILRLTT